ncbi:replicative DNA helicase [Desulfovibrio sp. OttesenSCG-928-C06]|nr:replicative DNA helicase [Desulfovibrio sp. OttesenSCG-928-C06]
MKEQAEADLVRNVPPHSVDAEQAVLGGILLNPDALDEILSLINAEDFYIPAHRLIYTACISLLEKNAPVNMVSVREYLKDNGLLEESGGAVYLATLAQSVISSARVDYYATIVRDKSQLRALITSCSGIITKSFEPGLDAKTMLDESEAAIMAVAERRSDKTYKSSAELTHKVFEELDARAQRRDLLTGINTGFPSMNRMTGGFQRSDLIILAARPAMGKTAFVLNLAMRAAEGDSTHEGVPVAIFSLEMSMDQLIQRMLCARGRVDLSKLRRNQLQDGDWVNLQKAAEVMTTVQMFIDDTPALSIMDLRSRARRLKREKNIGLIVIDYLQLMRASRRVDSRELEISEISRGLKALAKELNVPVIALSQLNRKVEERADKRPMLSDLRESGAIEQDADVIMFIYRDSAYQKTEERPERDVAEIIFGKHRNGQVGTVELMWVPAYTQFEEFMPGVNAPYSG